MKTKNLFAITSTPLVLSILFVLSLVGCTKNEEEQQQHPNRLYDEIMLSTGSTMPHYGTPDTIHIFEGNGDYKIVPPQRMKIALPPPAVSFAYIDYNEDLLTVRVDNEKKLIIAERKIPDSTMITALFTLVDGTGLETTFLFKNPGILGGFD